MNTGRLSKYTSGETGVLNELLWKAAKYERISRKDEKEKDKSNSIESQEKLINYYLRKNIDITPYDDYIDDDYTGFNFDRPGFKRMVQDIETGKVNCIIIKDLSRFGRDHQLMLHYILVQVPRWNIRFIAINDHVDSFKDPESMKSAEMRINLFFNDEYGWVVSESVKESLTARRKRGMFIGSFASYGYQKDPCDHHKLIIDEEAANVVKFIFKSFIQGMSILSITRKLNGLGIPNPTQYKKNSGLNVSVNCIKKTEGMWSDRTVRRILTKQIYLGHLVQKQLEVPNLKFKKCKAVPKGEQIISLNTHEPIIDSVTFVTVQNLLKRDTRSSPITKELSVFAGFVKCADCGRAMVKRTVTQPYKTYQYYNCATYRKLHECTKHPIQIDMLEAAVLGAIQNQVVMAVQWNPLIEKINNSPSRDMNSQRLISSIKNLEKLKIKKMTYLEGLYPDYKNELLSLNLYTTYKMSTEKEIEDIKTQITNLENELNEYKNGASGTESFISNFLKFKNITKLTREVILELIDMIWVHDNGMITIDFKFADSYNRTVEFIDNNRDVLDELKLSISKSESSTKAAV